MAIPNQRLWVIGGVVLVGVVLLSGEREGGDGREEERCDVEVTADVLNVRDGAGTDFDVVDQLRDGETIEATPIVRNDFRQLSEGRWAAAQFLVVTDGCG